MSGRRLGLLVFVAALAVRLAVVLALGLGSPPASWGDDADYDALARGIAGSSHVYANSWFPPGYPFFLAAIYGVAGPSPAAVRLVQAVLSAATCWVIFAIGRHAFGLAAGGIAGLLLAFYPGHAYMAWRLMAETPFILLIAVAVSAGQRAAAAGSPRLAAAAGAALGAATLFKSNLALAAPLLLLWPAWAMAGGRRRRAAVLAAGTAACVLALAALPLANAGSPGRSAALLPGNGGPTLWWSNNPLADGYFVDPDRTAAGRDFIARHGLAPAALQSRDPFLRSRADRQLALAWMRENPGAFLQLAGRKLWNAFGVVPRAEAFAHLRLAAWLHALSYGGLLPLIGFGVWRSRRAWRAAIPCYLLLAASVAMTVICYGSPRFTLLVMPFLLIFAGAAVAAPAAQGVAAPARRAPPRLPVGEPPMPARRLRVAFVGGRGVIGTYSGIETYYEEVGSRLAARGHEVTAYCRSYFTPDLAEYRGIRIRRLPCLRTKHLETLSHSLLSTLSICLRRDHDLVQFHAVGSALLAWAPRLFGRATVVSVRGLDWQRGKWGAGARRALQLGEWAAVRCPTATVVVSQTLQRHFAERHGRATLCIPNAVMPARRRPPDRIHRHGLAGDDFVLFAGRLSPEKGVHTLIEALRPLPRRCRLVIAGGSSYSQEYIDELRRTAWDEVLFLGNVDHDTIAELLSHCYAYVLPSTMEGLSIGLLEALSYGSCIVASDIPENREVLGDAGLTFPPGDVLALRACLAALLDDPARVETYRRRASERARSQPDWDEVAGRTEALYLELLDGRPPRRAAPPAAAEAAPRHADASVL